MFIFYKRYRLAFATINLPYAENAKRQTKDKNCMIDYNFKGRKVLIKSASAFIICMNKSIEKIL